MHKNFPILGLHMVAFDLSFTYVLVSSKGNNQHLLLKCDNISKHFSPVKHCSLFKTKVLTIEYPLMALFHG